MISTPRLEQSLAIFDAQCMFASSNKLEPFWSKFHFYSFHLLVSTARSLDMHSKVNYTTTRLQQECSHGGISDFSYYNPQKPLLPLMKIFCNRIGRLPALVIWHTIMLYTIQREAIFPWSRTTSLKINFGPFFSRSRVQVLLLAENNYPIRS